MHEANLHHLIADLTINRDDWDAYVREVGRNHGPEAEEYAERYVRTRQRAPDYSLSMMRSVLARSRGAIVHSDAVGTELRAQGFEGPIARIPHGAWTGPADRMSYRARLGLAERTPLIGVFGFLKPYKRIAESLRAFRRLVRAVPDARMILVGEAHPELPLKSLIGQMNLEPHVRHLDFVPMEDFSGYLGACDIVLNLRYPTVGESSGTLQRALGMGKAVIVSDVGSFRELPDEVCLKAPIGSAEEEHLFEYMNLLATRPAVRSALAERARAWAERECSWEVAARRYAEFLEAVAEGRDWQEPAKASAVAAPAGEPPAAVHVEGDYIASWAPAEDGSRDYVETHRTRLERTLALTPPGGPEDRILEMGAYLQITPALKTRLGYGEVRGCYYGPRGETNHRRVTSENGEEFRCEVDLFDAEKDCFPYKDGYFSTVLCCELIEHLPSDPMHMMSRDQPHPEARRSAGAHHAQYRFRARGVRDSAGVSSHAVSGLHPPESGRRDRGSPQPRVFAARDQGPAGEFRVRGHRAGNRAVPRRAQARAGLGGASARPLHPAEGASRRRDLRCGPQAARGARPLPGMVV